MAFCQHQRIAKEICKTCSKAASSHPKSILHSSQSLPPSQSGSPSQIGTDGMLLWRLMSQGIDGMPLYVLYTTDILLSNYNTYRIIKYAESTLVMLQKQRTLQSITCFMIQNIKSKTARNACDLNSMTWCWKSITGERLKYQHSQFCNSAETYQKHAMYKKHYILHWGLSIFFLISRGRSRAVIYFLLIILFY